MGRYHAEKLARIPEVQLAAVVDAEAARGSALAQKLNCPAFGDYREIFQKAEAVIVAVPTDINDEDARQRLVEASLAEFGKVDCLINNAFGIPPMDPITQIKLEDLRAAQETNVFAPLRLSALFADALAETPEKPGGSIIMVNSCVVYQSQPEYSGYKLSKGALKHLASSLSTVLGPRGIRVNSIAPSYIYEDVNKAYFDWLASEAGTTHEEIYRQKAEPTDLKRLATPDEVARAALFYASDLASCVTGTMLNVDCGEFHDD